MQKQSCKERSLGRADQGEGCRRTALPFISGRDNMSVLRVEKTGNGRQVCWLAMADIHPNDHQPRQHFDDVALMELASSIRKHGLLQPITVRCTGKGYEIVMGERRFRACRMLGYTHIDAFVLPISQDESAILALIENIQRENLHYFEEAEAYAALLDKGMSREELARQLGKSPSAVANKLRLMKLDQPLRELLTEEGLSERHARALLSLPDSEGRMRIARQAAVKQWTVRQTEEMVLKAQQRLPVPPQGRRVISLVRDQRLYVNAIRSIVRQMEESGLPARMDVQNNGQETDIHIRMG